MQLENLQCKLPCGAPGRPLLAALEPLALDLWRHEIADWLPAAARAGGHKQSFFGGLYQKIVIGALKRLRDW